MVCANIKKLLSLMVFTTLGAVPVASAQTSWKLYDVRDLIGLLPPPHVEGSAENAQSGQQVYIGLQNTPKPKPRQPDPVEALMDRLCGGLGVGHTVLFAGVYGIEGEESEHAALLGMLEQVRALYAQRYDVEVVWYESPVEGAPQIGDPVTPASPAHRHQLVATRRTPTELVQFTRHAYIQSLQPVVATGAMGYSPETGHVEQGFHASILVGAGRETETTSSIRVRGDLRDVAMGKMSGTVTGVNAPDAKTVAEQRGIRIELPQVSIRSIRSNIAIEYGKLTAVAVVDGFGDGQCIVVAASVQRLRD